MKFKKSREGKAINYHLDKIQKEFSFHIFVRRLPDAIHGGTHYIGSTPINSVNGRWVSHWPNKWTVYGMPPCQHWRTFPNPPKPCVCDQQGRRKLYRIIKQCFQAKHTLADVVHYAIWNTQLGNKPFVLMNLTELIKNLRAACPNPGNLV